MKVQDYMRIERTSIGLNTDAAIAVRPVAPLSTIGLLSSELLLLIRP